MAYFRKKLTEDPAARALPHRCIPLPPISILLFPLSLLLTSFSPFDPAAERPRPACDPGGVAFEGYTFLIPDIINKNAAYAPFLLQWDDYYEEVYFHQDLQKQENVTEWNERFCQISLPEDIEQVVYKSGFQEMGDLREAAGDREKLTPLPYALRENTFAEVLAHNGCVEPIDYLMYAKKCEPYVVGFGDRWTLPEVDSNSMQQLIQEGLGRFRQTESHFVRLRYAYQIVRLAHYSRQYEQTVELFNFLVPKIDRKKPSIIFFWTLGHLAGSLQKLGRYPEAAYRYSLIFRHCPSKRVQAFRSFRIRNDRDWDETLRLCQNDAERATLLLMRAGGSRRFAVADMEEIYALDPANPQLELLAVSDIQEMEKIFLQTPVTVRKYGRIQSAIRRDAAAQHLLDLQKFVRRVLKDERQPNQKLWRALAGYLELLAGDFYAAGKSWERTRTMLDTDEEYDARLARQLEIWELLLEILRLDPASAYIDDAAFRLRSYETFRAYPSFEPFLQDWLSERYAAANRPGKALLAAYPPEAIKLNPRLDVIDDLLLAAREENPILMEETMQLDTNPDRITAWLLEVKGTYFFSVGQPEAALLTLRSIPPTQQALMPKFSPFREVFDERVHRPMTDSLLLNRLEIIEKIIDLELKAKAAAAVDDPVAAWNYYLIGLAHYNMSYFGYEWDALDYYRSGYNWLRLAQGPVYPLRGSPHGNRENVDVDRALYYFEQSLAEAQTPEMAARAAFMAARCRQKQWFALPDTRYQPGSNLIPVLPEAYRTYYDLLISRYSGTASYAEIVRECRWLAAYAR